MRVAGVHERSAHIPVLRTENVGSSLITKNSAPKTACLANQECGGVAATTYMKCSKSFHSPLRIR